MKALGVGLVYWAALESLFKTPELSLGVLELEPQTLWEKVCTRGVWHYRTNEALLDRVAELPQAKLLHGVGHPLGGTCVDPIDPFPELRRAVQRLNPAWTSEHLSFNRTWRKQAVEDAGFLLPPPQTPAAVRVAATNIERMRDALGCPVAFETGVNYLHPHEDEMSDGAFFGSVAESADSGILLDLHNLWCNQLNGRQTIAQALAEIPLDRVWEIHLAGGMQHGGHWLDSHSAAIPDELIDVAAGLVPRLPRLGALIFEILPEHLPNIGLDGVQRQVEWLHRLWNLRASSALSVSRKAANLARASLLDFADVAERERALVEAIEARKDAGCAVYRELIDEIRKANLVRALRYTMTALLAGLGPQRTEELLGTYFEVHSPEPYAALEADSFARFLRTRSDRLPEIRYLDEVLAFEHALVRATTHGESCEISWTVNPVGLFEALDAGVLPAGLPPQNSRLCISAEPV